MSSSSTNADAGNRRHDAFIDRSDDSGSYINRRMLESVEAFRTRSIQRSTVGDCGPAETSRVEQFLSHEARLLDMRRYEDWFNLFTEDFVYWIPSVHGIASLQTGVSVNFDDRRRILDRIVFTTSAGAMAQTPPSRTVRVTSNVQAWHGEGELLEVTANLVIWAHRRGRTESFAGQQQMLLQPAGDTFAIKIRILNLLDCDEPQGNNTFIL